MKNSPIITAFTLPLLLFLTGCTGYSSSTKESKTIEDNLSLRGGCVIAGTVIDNNTNKPVTKANIVVFSNPISTVTDLYGQFEIIDMIPGTYTLQVFCVGYVQKDIPNIEVRPDRLIKLIIRLEPRPDQNE